MDVRRIELSNFRKFEELTFNCPDEKILVLTGKNGSGKSSILDAIAKCFDQYIGKLTSFYDKSHSINDSLEIEDITNGKSEVSVSCDIGNELKIKISKRRDQGGTGYEFDENYFQDIREKMLANIPVELPLMVYYRINRTVALGKKDKKKSAEGFYHPVFESYFGSIEPYGSPFTDFEQWFILRENIENEMIKQKKDFDFQLPELEAFRKVISRFLSFFYDDPKLNIQVYRNTSEHRDPFKTSEGKIFVVFGDKKTSVMLSQLSSGEKMIFLIIADIARRLLILNSGNTEFEKHTGIVLIDEIGLHLHPQWQRQILPALHHVFPNLQFICTTHSPQVISLLEQKNILKIEDQGIYHTSSNPMGGESGRTLEETFDTSRRPPKAQELIEEIYQYLGSSEIDFNKVEKQIKQLQKMISVEDPEFLRIKNYMKRRKLLLF